MLDYRSRRNKFLRLGKSSSILSTKLVGGLIAFDILVSVRLFTRTQLELSTYT